MDYRYCIEVIVDGQKEGIRKLLPTYKKAIVLDRKLRNFIIDNNMKGIIVMVRDEFRQVLSFKAFR